MAPASASNNKKPPSSPFFAPSTPKTVSNTPGGTKRTVKKPVEELKSSLVGTTANLINAIVGSGIVGIPYAIYCSGLLAGIVLVMLCALLTMTSLRLLIFTAQYVKVPSYETLCEASFGRVGFLFITANMFIMAYGAMVSYLMIVKDTIPLVLGVDETDESMKRAILFILSLTVMVPLSAQRDMADLAKTSRLSVACDAIMVVLVAYQAPFPQKVHDVGWKSIITHSTIEPSTVFIGLGVLSFAFVCQHSAFIIAGSLDRPTKARWTVVTRRALIVCVILALACGITGFLGYGAATQGNILNNLDPTNLWSNLARGLLGSTMLFVYPMESFVARHVLVVLLFQGRRAHEGEDASILNRRDRRWGMTVLLYIMALIPAMLFQNLGSVLSVTGAIGGSCLSYIGPGMCYLGVYGSDFMELVNQWLGTASSPVVKEELLPLTAISTTTPPTAMTTTTTASTSSCFTVMIRTCLYYLLGLPLWTKIATVGAAGLVRHNAEQVQKSPHISRIAGRNTTNNTLRKSQSYQNPNFVPANLQPPARPTKGVILQIPPIDKVGVVPVASIEKEDKTTTDENNEESVHKPKLIDFIIAICFMLFGIVAMVAGLGSIFMSVG